MAQIATYRVCAGVTNMIRPLISDPHTLVVNDTLSRDVIETQLHEKITQEWVAAKKYGGLFDLEKISHDGGLATGGRFAINPDHLTWLNTELLSLEPAGQPTTPD